MSKESFSKTISKTMYRKLRNIEDHDFTSFFSKDENFIMALCLSYMTLSKEKIIEKDMKNKDRMARLTQMVDTNEINKVFTPGFAEEMPTITYAKENNNLWILDNIRDSIMHGVFDIDENKKCFLINNTQFDRELVAEVPFSWFIAYAKNDILAKKELDNYTIRGFYYNKGKKYKKDLETKKELINNILYRVNIKGNKFNVRDIEKRVRELFDLYSKDDISDEEINKYRKELDKEKIKYNEKYLVSFYIARKKVKEKIEQEFPGTDVKIFIDNRKQRLANKFSKRMNEYYYNYDLMFDTFNKLRAPKGISLLQYISNIIEILEDNKSQQNSIDLLSQTLEIANVDNPLNGKNLNILRSICLNVYGLSTLVINHENLYKQHFLNRNPSEFGIYACSKSPYLEYANKSKSIVMKILDSEIKLFKKQEQLKGCTNEQAKVKLQQDINSIKIEISNHEATLDSLVPTLKFDEVIKEEDIDYDQRQKLENTIQTYFKHFHDATTVEAKRKIKKLIGSLLDFKKDEESKYTYGYCNSMEDALTIIRNSFSHIGRIFMGKDKGEETTVILNDYDSNNEKSGVVTCRYNDLIELLESPYEFSKNKGLN